MQSLIIGGMDGCHEELRSLLDCAGLNTDNAITSVGDCVDGGPAISAMLKFTQGQPNTRLILGKHECKHIRGNRYEVKLAWSQQTSRIQFGETYTVVLPIETACCCIFILPENLVLHGFLNRGCLWNNNFLPYYATRWVVKNICGFIMNETGMNNVLGISLCWLDMKTIQAWTNHSQAVPLLQRTGRIFMTI